MHTNIDGTGLVYIVKNFGPKTDPCGTLYSIKTGFDDLPSMVTV